MLGHLYDRALGGERCWVRHDDGEVRVLPAHRWLGDRGLPNGSEPSDEVFDETVTQMCSGPTIELGCGPGRLVARLIRRGIPALGIDRSATAIRLTVLLVDGNVGLGGDPRRILGRAAELLCSHGHCVAEFDAEAVGIRTRWVRLESARDVGPWFRWASVGVDSATTLAGQVGLTLTSIRLIGGRVIANLTAL